MGEVADQRVVELDPGVAVETPVWLVVSAEGGDCAIASGAAAEGGVAVGPIGAARAAWLGDQVRVSTSEVAACAGLPRVEELAVPASGTVVGLKFPVVASDTTGPFAVGEIGDGWWHVRPTDGGQGGGRGAVVFRHAEAPPTAFLAVSDPSAPEPAGTTLRVDSGGVLVVDRDASWTSLADHPVARVIDAGPHTIVLGRAPGRADGVWRVGQGTPEPLHVEVGARVRPSDVELVVRAGGQRVRRPDVPVTAAHVADEQVARVEVDGARLRITGVAPGRTRVALVGEDGVHVLAVVVASP